MSEVFFYHLSSSPLEAVLPTLLSKSLENGWRILVRTSGEDRSQWLDEKLWIYDDASFLPHGREGGNHDGVQPVLISTGNDADHGRDCLIVVDGAEVTADEVGGLARASVIFDGNDPDSLDKARGQWKLLSGAGLTAHYWAQDGGSWVQKFSTAE